MNNASPVPDPAPSASHTLANGARITLDPRPHAASVAVVLHLVGGTREEDAASAGHLHLLEHLLLRRTARCDAASLARRIAALGGLINAETDREHLVLIGRAPAAQAPALAELLVECLCEPGFDETDLALEQGVIDAERTFVGQTPVDEALLRLAWPEHPLGCPVLPAKPVPASPAALRTLWARQAAGTRLRVAVAGGFDPPAMHAALDRLSALPTGTRPAWGAAPLFVPGRYGQMREDRPATLMWALPCPDCRIGDLPAWELTATALQQALTRALRESGLAYACAVWPQVYSDAGLILVRVAAPPGRVVACADRVEQQFDAFAAGGLSPDERALAHQTLAARRALAADDLESCARDAAAAQRPLRTPPATSGYAAVPPARATLRVVVSA